MDEGAAFAALRGTVPSAAEAKDCTNNFTADAVAMRTAEKGWSEAEKPALHEVQPVVRAVVVMLLLPLQTWRRDCLLC